MQFLIHFKIKPEHRDSNFNRVKEKGHGVPPGVKLLGPLVCSQSASRLGHRRDG